jgi:sugar phosphate isomerase/epimerase
MKEFLEKGMSGLIGYATPRVQYSYFNVEAAAEWGWNLNGRSPREFAYSWAVRQGLRNPEKFADWCETLGEASWEVYGSDWPAGEQRSIPGKSAERLLKGTLPPLGFVLWDAFRLPWGDIKSAKRLEENLTNAGRAVRLAREMGRPEFYFESLYIQGHLRALKALYELRSLVRDGRVEPDRRDEARRWFREYIRGLEQAADVLPRWEATVYIFPGDVLFTEKPVNIIRGMISEMKDVARRVGCPVD